MGRAVLAGVVTISIALAGCSGGGGALPFANAPACPLLAQLARTGQTVQRANVSDPGAFQQTLQTAVAEYVRTAKRLRAAVPARLGPDVDRMIVAARAHRFADADGARSEIDDYARSACKAV
jgi:hypothetical protein